MRTTRSGEDYLKYIAVYPHELEQEKINDLIALRKNINEQLADDNSQLSIQLRSLSENDKTLLMSALICNDGERIRNIIYPALASSQNEAEKTWELSQYISVAESPAIQGNDLFNRTTQLILQKLLKTKENEDLTSYDVTRILTNAMARIPDTIMTVVVKTKICDIIYPSHQGLFTEYNEYVTPITENIPANKIRFSQFKVAASAANKIDYSEYILLSLGLLQNYADKTVIDEIHQQYININYEKCMEIIGKICDDFKNEIDAANGKGASLWIKEAGKKAHEVNIERNYSRRFFENRIAGLYYGQAANFDGINRINHYFLGPPHGHYENVKDINGVLSAFASINDIPGADILARRTIIRRQMSVMKRKGRIQRKGYLPKDEEGEEGKMSQYEVFSKNKGVMLSKQPNYTTDLANEDLRNNNPDINYFKQDESLYPLMMKRSAYVASISGHAILMTAILEKYMQENKDSNTLEEDINHYVKAFTANYIGRGYHSLLEMIDIFRDPVIQKVFNDCNVKLDLSWSSPILSQAFMDTQGYTRELVLQRAMRSELFAAKVLDKLHLAVAKNDLTRVQNLLSAGTKTDVRDQEGRTALHYAVANASLDIAIELIRHSKVSDLNIEDNRGMTPLYIAISLNKEELISKLIESGADIHAVNKDGITPFHLAMSKNQFDIINIFLKNGVEINANQLDSILLSAVEHKHLELIATILDKNKEIENTFLETLVQHAKSNHVYDNDFADIINKKKLENYISETSKREKDSGALLGLFQHKSAGTKQAAAKALYAVAYGDANMNSLGQFESSLNDGRLKLLYENIKKSNQKMNQILKSGKRL